MESDTELAAVALNIAVILKRKEKRKKRLNWVKPWLQKHLQLGMYDTPEGILLRGGG